MADNGAEIELQRITPKAHQTSHNGLESEANLNVQQFQLKPADGGAAAWKALIAAFMFEAILWGFPISFGVFQQYYSTLPQFKDSSNIAIIGTTTQGIGYLCAPLSSLVAKRFPKYQRLQIWVGWVICIGGLIAGSFATSLGALVATQGIMFGIGFVMLTYPIVSMVDEWWIAKKGMAFGVISSASGFSGAVMPFICEALLSRYGYKITLRAIAIGMAILTGPMLPFLIGRLPPAEHSVMGRTDWSFLKKPLFWVYTLATFVYGFGFFFPSIYLPSYAASVGLSTSKGALLLATMAIAQVPGQFAFGYLSDKKNSVSLLSVICMVVATVASFSLWGLAKSLAPLLVFSMLYGFFAYGFTSMRVAMGKAVSQDPSAGVATFSILVFFQGIGNILVGPVSARLISKGVTIGGYGVMKYKGLVICTGSCMLGSALIISLWHLRPKKVGIWM